MISLDQRVRGTAMFLAVWAVCLMLQACGGGASGNSGGDSAGSDVTPSPRATSTPRSSPTPQRTSTRTPLGPPQTQPAQSATPTPLPTAVPPTEVPTATPAILVVTAGGNIAAAARNSPDGGTVVVAPGTYSAVLLEPGDLQGSLTLFADVTGEFTTSSPAPVIIVATGRQEAAFEAFSQSGLAIAGFTLRGGTDAAFLCADCAGVTVQDCTATGSAGDGVRFERSQDALIFNNLLIGNKGAGVAAHGSTNLQIINNTIYRNSTAGIFLSLDENQNPSTDAFLRNNVLNKNTPTGIVVDLGPPTSLDGFDANFNLNTDGHEGTIQGPNDALSDPLFILPTGGDFHVAVGSQVIDGGTDDIGDDLVSALQELTTQTDGTLDTSQPDLGFHYVAPIPTPTRVRRDTRTPTPTARNTNTPTRARTP